MRADIPEMELTRDDGFWRLKINIDRGLPVLHNGETVASMLSDRNQAAPEKLLKSIILQRNVRKYLLTCKWRNKK